ncbi:transposase family protein [Streptomyces sp. NPDC088812]|uniref:transposase family protein n=1 Tax=Streptomyces sp. NPDC088812 TaxID=3365905 RepID=UPI00381A7FA8
MPTALDQLGRAAAPVPLADAVALSGFLDLVPDPRGVRGRRYRLSALVAAAAASVLAGARSLTAITEWSSCRRPGAGPGRDRCGPSRRAE